MKPPDSLVLRQAVGDARRAAHVDVAFAGWGDDRGLVITELSGARTPALRGLTVRSGRGVGGLSLQFRRPVGVDDYLTAPRITHDYDRPVWTEGVRALVGVPIVVEGRGRAVLYLGNYAHASVGAGTIESVQGIVERVAGEVRIHDEVERRLAEARQIPSPVPAPTAERARTCWAELRDIVRTCDDPDLARRIEASMRLLVHEADDPAGLLTGRETDVIGLVALGATNRVIADRLGVGPETVKTHLRNIMRKLGASSRLEAVSLARRRGEIA